MKVSEYMTCGKCPQSVREECPVYEPNTDDLFCIYDLLRARREREEKERKGE